MGGFHGGFTTGKFVQGAVVIARWVEEEMARKTGRLRRGGEANQ